MRVKMSVVLIVLCCNLGGKLAHAQIVIENSELREEEIFQSSELIGYRNLPTDVFAGTLYSEGPVGIPIEFAASTIREYAANTVGYSGAYTESLFRVSQEINKFQYVEAGFRSWEPSVMSVSLPWVKDGFISHQPVDTAMVAALISENIVNSGIAVFDNELGGVKRQLLVVDFETTKQLMTAYTEISAVMSAEPVLVTSSIQLAESQIAQLGTIQSAAVLKFGPVSYGIPIVYTADEKDLSVPSSVTSQFDVHWIEFAISLREINASEYEQIEYVVQLPPDSYALALVPLNHGVELETQDRIAVPSTSVTVGDAGISVGEVFSRTVEYKTLKPTITAVGLQESHFYWRMRDEALNSGSVRVVAVVATPRGTDSITTIMSANLRFPSILGLVQGSVASTQPIVVPIGLN